MSTTTIVFIALLLIIIVGLIFAFTSNLFSRRDYPPGYQYGYGYPPPGYQHPHYRREYEDRSSSFWPFMILLTIGAVLYLSSYAGGPETETNRSKAVPPYGDTGPYETKENNRERGKKDPNYVIRDYDTDIVRRQQKYEPDAYDGQGSYQREKGLAEKEQRPQPPSYTIGYGIQLFASEKDWLSAEDKEKLRRRFGGRPLLQSPKRINGSLFKCIIVGGFDTEAEAMDTRRVLIRDFGKNIRVVPLSDLKELSRYE